MPHDAALATNMPARTPAIEEEDLFAGITGLFEVIGSGVYFHAVLIATTLRSLQGVNTTEHGRIRR